MTADSFSPCLEENSSVRLVLDGSLARISLNRPAVHNAFNAEVVHKLHGIFDGLVTMDGIRAILLTGAGKSFSAGGDLAAMKKAGAMRADDNYADALALADMLHAMNSCPKPVITVAHGHVMGGGVGLVACSDSVIAVEGTRFALSEVRLGLEPSTISPYVVQAMGLHWARRLFVTGEFFPAARAAAIGLVHEVAASHEQALKEAQRQVALIVKNGPQAVSLAKELAFEVHGTGISGELRARTARRIADRRASAEAREGISAFLDKRKPDWSEG